MVVLFCKRSIVFQLECSRCHFNFALALCHLSVHWLAPFVLGTTLSLARIEFIYKKIMMLQAPLVYFSEIVASTIIVISQHEKKSLF